MPSRREVWDVVRGLAADGTTVLLTTHYLDEADRLSDRIAVIDRGRHVVEDTPEGLKRMIGGDRLEVLARDGADLPDLTRVLSRACGDPSPRVEPDLLRVHAAVTDRVAAVGAVLKAAEEAGIEVADIALRQPTLDEVFLRLTGRPAGDAADAPSIDDTTPTETEVHS